MYSILALTIRIPSKLTNFVPRLRISLNSNRKNDIHISWVTLDAQEEEYKYKYEYY